MRITIVAAVCFVCQTALLEAQSAQPAAPSGQPKAAEQAPLGQRLYLRAADALERRFYDPTMAGLDWPKERDALLPHAAAATTQAQCSAVINQLIDRLHASHTHHFIPTQREYYELLDVFYPQGPDEDIPNLAPGRVRYVGAGLVTRTIDSKLFVADVYPQGPADAAGIHIGDELLTVNNQPWSDIDVFKGHAGESLPVRVRREPKGPELTLSLTPESIQPRKQFLKSLRASARVDTHEGHRLAYVRVRSYAHASYQEAVVDLLHTTFADADGLILDLRGGWGGAVPSYLEAFNTMIPAVDMRRRDDPPTASPVAWQKPMVVLVDHGTRSGKEILSFGFKNARRATLVGETTAGAVLGGSPEVLPDGSLLLIAVADVHVNGQRLEAVGVAPDITVPRPIPYCNNADPQLDAARTELARLIKASKP